jgi:transcription initiation factor IIE alpha subunit
MNEFKVQLTLAEVYQALCPKCKQRLLDVATRHASVDQLRENLKRQLENTINNNADSNK